jgi:hypothetical protein
MKVIIAGSRGFTDYNFLCECVLRTPIKITEVVSGRCKNSPDMLGERWAKENGVPIAPFPALWDKYGKAAGFIRNREMALYADALIAVWDNKSRGTRHMIETARGLFLRSWIYYF